MITRHEYREITLSHIKQNENIFIICMLEDMKTHSLEVTFFSLRVMVK